MDNVPVYYCVECGYVGTAPGNCPECGGEMMSDEVSLPHEKEDERYEDGLLEEEEDEDDTLNDEE